MNESKFKFDRNIPSEILPSIQKNFLALEYLIPDWYQVVGVYYNIDPDGEGLSVRANGGSCASHEYRYGEIDIYPNYFNQDETERMRTCIHEVSHLMTWLIYDYARDEIGRLLPENENQKYRESLLQELRRRNESVVCDLTHILQKWLGVVEEGA